MLIDANSLYGCPIASLHIGGVVAEVVDLIVDPNTLKLIAVEADGSQLDEETGFILPMSSVREFGKTGMIIDSVDEFVGETDVIKIRKVLELNFRLDGKKVVTESKVKLGKVASYILQTEGWRVHQLVVAKPMMQAFLTPELIVARSQIVEVNDEKVVVKNTAQEVGASAGKKAEEIVESFVNPFRKARMAERKE